mgnify:FL=1
MMLPDMLLYPVGGLAVVAITAWLLWPRDRRLP